MTFAAIVRRTTPPAVRRASETRGERVVRDRTSESTLRLNPLLVLLELTFAFRGVNFCLDDEHPRKRFLVGG
jgi:hypothetical protein